ncbi:BatA and WFA domain-containing protein [Povalibacter sp.]|uniref:BatA and WFA domain-containing protein n=1 Tax=Povalibacter sp. TaxID=1962978 RepID=UPI002F3F80EC
MFLTPAILAGLLAIGLPLWLHRVARANPTRHPFASLMLLEASETQRTAKRTLRYWLLLALRVLLLIVLVLAFAGPLVPPRAVPVVNRDARLHAIVLDTSLSMQYGDRWQRAVDAARDIIDGARPGDQLLLVEAAGRRIQVAHTAVGVNQRDAVRTALGELRPGNERLDYGLLMSTASAWLGTARLPVELHVISDMQQSATPLRFADLEPPAGTRSVFHDMGAEPSSNTFIETVQREGANEVAAHVRTSATTVLKLEAVLVIDGVETARRPLQIGPARLLPGLREGEGNPPPDLLVQARQGDAALANARVLLPLPTLNANTHRMEVRLEPQDALPQDDRHFSILERSNPRVLVVSRSRDADDALYAAAAIGSASAPRLDTEQRPASEIEGRNLQSYAAIVITDMAALSSAAGARIADYVSGGGAALVMLGPGMSEQRSGVLAGLSLRTVVTKPTRVSHVEVSHPALRNADGWQDVHFLRYLRVAPGEQDKVLIGLQDGGPLLIERSVGAGRLLVLTTPLARDWNDFATHPLFVNFMAQTANWLTGAGAATASARVGAVVMTGLTAAQGGQIFDPQGRRVLTLDATANADRLIPEQSGFYEIRTGAGARWLAVNNDIRESNLARMSDQSRQRWLKLERPESPTSVAPDANPATPGRVSIGYWLLLLAMLLAVAQILAANHFLAVRREVPR